MVTFDKDQSIKEYLGINGPHDELTITGPDPIPGLIRDITSFSGKNMRVEVIRSSDMQDLQATLYSLYGKLSDMGYKIYLAKQIPDDFKAKRGKGVVFLYEGYIDLNDDIIISRIRGILSGRYQMPGKGITVVLGLTTSTFSLLSEPGEQTREEQLADDRSEVKTTPDEKTKVLGFGLVLLSIPMIITWFGILSGLYSLIAGAFLRWFILIDTVAGISVVLFVSYRYKIQKRKFVYLAGLLFLSLNIAAYLLLPSYSISDYFSNVNFPLYFVRSSSSRIMELNILADFDIIITAVAIILLILPFLRKKMYFLLLFATGTTCLSIIFNVLIQFGVFSNSIAHIPPRFFFISENLFPFFTTTLFHLNPYFAISINGYVYYYLSVLTFLVFVFSIISNLIFSVIYFSAGIRTITSVGPDVKRISDY